LLYHQQLIYLFGEVEEFIFRVFKVILYGQRFQDVISFSPGQLRGVLRDRGPFPVLFRAFFVDRFAEVGEQPEGWVVLCDLFGYAGGLPDKRVFPEVFKAEVLRGRPGICKGK